MPTRCTAKEREELGSPQDGDQLLLTGTTLIAGQTTYSAMLPSEQNAASGLPP